MVVGGFNHCVVSEKPLNGVSAPGMAFPESCTPLQVVVVGFNHCVVSEQPLDDVAFSKWQTLNDSPCTSHPTPQALNPQP